MIEERVPLKATASVSMKLNTGKYESVDLFLSISNLDSQTTVEEINELLDTSVADAFVAIKLRMREKAIEIRKKAGGE